MVSSQNIEMKRYTKMRLQMLLLLFKLLAYTSGERSRKLFICEHAQNNTITLSCTNQHKLHIMHANYGRETISVCREGANGVTNCTSISSEQKVKALCDGKRTCSLKASNSLFGDTCRGITKYLTVKYQCTSLVHPCLTNNGGCEEKCIQKGGKTICDCITPGSILDKDRRTCLKDTSRKLFSCELDAQNVIEVSCPYDLRIHIMHANYGRESTVVCPEGAKGVTYCRSASSERKVGERCNGKIHCILQAGNAMFRDTCPGITKYLTVKYQCIKSVHPCFTNNGGCEEKCITKGNKAVCGCITPGATLGKDMRTCLGSYIIDRLVRPLGRHPCSNNNGGCQEKCYKHGDKAICRCVSPGTELDKDGKTCVNGRVTKMNILLKVTLRASPLRASHRSMGWWKGYEVTGTPRMFIHLMMARKQRLARFVPENCYATPTKNRLDPYRVYLIRDRFPVVSSYIQHVLEARIFRFSVLPSMLDKRPTYIHCISRICPLTSRRCYFTDRNIFLREDEKPEEDEIPETFVHSMAKLEPKFDDFTRQSRRF